MHSPAIRKGTTFALQLLLVINAGSLSNSEYKNPTRQTKKKKEMKEGSFVKKMSITARPNTSKDTKSVPFYKMGCYVHRYLIQSANNLLPCFMLLFDILQLKLQL